MPRTSSSAADVLAPYIAAQVAAIRRHEPLAREGDADAIHDMRVAVRRLKAVLVAYRSAFDPATGRHLCDELDWLATTLGNARDHDVQRLILKDLLASDEGVAQIDAADRTMAADSQSALAAALISARYRVLAEELEEFGAQPPWTQEAEHSAKKVLLASLARQFARVDSRIDSAKKASSRAKVDERLHRVRKSVKRARYATEACAPILSQKQSNLAHELSLAQDSLGDHNDLVVTRGNSDTWTDLGVTAIDDDALAVLDARARKTRRQARHALRSVRKLAEVGQSLSR